MSFDGPVSVPVLAKKAKKPNGLGLQALALMVGFATPLQERQPSEWLSRPRPELQVSCCLIIWMRSASLRALLLNNFSKLPPLNLPTQRNQWRKPQSPPLKTPKPLQL